jgi:hypothetical protein
MSARDKTPEPPVCRAPDPNPKKPALTLPPGAADWPHVMLESPMPNNGDLVDLIATWIPDEAARGLILVDNPQRLYGFT